LRAAWAAAAALALASAASAAPGWQYAAAGEGAVPASVRNAAARVTIAVVDTGADVTAPALAPRSPTTWNVLTNSPAVGDRSGHGTFVASLAAGFGGAARLMVVQAASTTSDFTDAHEAAAIAWAVDHGAQIVNLSLGGFDTSPAERDAIAYAVAHGVLVVAAAGNQAHAPLPVYPAALVAGAGLVVGASTSTGARASFSSTAPDVDLLAPGVYPSGSGTSFAAPEVAGAAALVWAANPALTAAQVARVLEQTASRGGRRTPGVGYGVVDAAAAVAAAPSA
jgi:subtilisin family serine protease